MISAKMATLGLLKISVSWNKVYDVIISLHGVINKNLSRDFIYIVNVVLWPGFGNFSISMREGIITSVLQWFELKNYFFRGIVSVQFQ